MRKKKTLIIGAVCVAVAIGTVLVLRAAASDPERHLTRGDEYFAKEAFDEARLEYLNALKKDPGNKRAIRQMGLTWAEMGAPIQAGMFLTKANEDTPGDLEVMRALANSLFYANQFGAAREMTLAILDKEPTDGDALLLLANASLSEEQLAEVTTRLKPFDPATSAYFHLASAIVASRKRDIEGAKASLDKALAVDGEAAAVHLARASYHEATNDRESLLAALAKASGVSPVRSPSRLRYARALAREEKSEEAEKLVREITETSRAYLPAWTLLAEWALQKGDTKEAMALLKEVLGRDSANPDANMLRASALLADGKGEEGVKVMEELGRVYPGNLALKMMLAQAYLKTDDAVRAGATLDEIVKAAPDHVEANLLQAQLNLRTGAAIAAANGLEKLLKLRPGLPQAEMLLARAYQAEGRLDDAAAVFRGQIERSPGEAGPHFMLGMMLRQQGKPDEALASFEAAQKVSPKDQAIVFQLIEVDLARKDFASAHRRADEQAELHPGDWAPLFFQGKVFSAEERWDEAEKALLQALEIKPDSLTVYDLLLGGYMAQGRVEEVIGRLETYLEQNPKGTPQRLILAMLHDRQGETAKAAATYERILADAPDFVTALNNLAYLCLGPLDDPDKALKLAGRARELSPGDAAIADTLGWAHFRVKQYAEALPLLEEAASKVPENPEIQYHLGMARYMRGQKDSARAALEVAAASEAPFAGIDEARKYLALANEEGAAGGETIESLVARLAETPGDVVSRLRLAALQEAEGKFKEAAAGYETALETNAGLVEALTGLARLHAGPLDNLERAADFARRARALDGQGAATARALGEVVLRQGDFRYAYNLLAEAARAAKDDPALAVNLARAAYGVGRTAEARSALQALADKSPASPEAAEADRFLALTDESAAPDEAAVAAALKADPEFLPALMAKASLARESGAPDDAAGILRDILKRHADFVPAQAALAALLATDPKQLDEAQQLADKARLALPDDPALARTLGLIRYGKDDAPSAIRFLKESEAKQPLDAEALFTLGMAHLKAEQSADATATLTRALADPTLPDALRQEAEKALERQEEEE